MALSAGCARIRTFPSPHHARARFPQWEEPYDIAGGGVTRFYLSDVKYGGKTHLFVAAVEGVDKAQLDAGLPAAERLVESAKVPADPA